MNTNYSRYQKIADISLVGIFTGMILATNVILRVIMGFDITIFLILICTIFFKKKISFWITLASALLAFFVNTDALMTLASVTICLIFWFIANNFKIILYRYFIITYILLLVFSILKYPLAYLFLFLVFDKQTAISIHLIYTLEMHFMLIGYLLIPIFATKRIFSFFKDMKNMNESYFNEKIKTEIRREADMNTFSNEKKHYNLQFASLLISMMVMIGALCYIPYAVSIWMGNYKWSAVVFITPLIMLFMTPVWLKRKNKVGNKSQVELNWIGITIGLTLILLPTCFVYENYSKVLQIHLLVIFFVGLLIFSIFIAGAIPMNMEIIKSYNLRNKLLENTKRTMGWTCFWLVPLPFIFNILNLNYVSLIMLVLPTVIVVILMLMNKNIYDKPNVLKINKENFVFLKQDKKFMTTLITQGYLYGISKFFEFGAILIFFVPMFENGIVLEANSWKLGLMIMTIFIAKYVFQAIFRSIKIMEQSSRTKNILGSSFILIGILTMVVYWIISRIYPNLFSNFDQTIWVYFGTLVFASILVSSGATMIDKSKKEMYRELVNQSYIGEALLLDHVAGNAIFNLLINAAFFVTLMLIPISTLSMLIYWNIILGITILVVTTNVCLLSKRN